MKDKNIKGPILGLGHCFWTYLYLLPKHKSWRYTRILIKLMRGEKRARGGKRSF
jgi:hypothetical protein